MKAVYRVSGFDCAGCAARFEQNVGALPGVVRAHVDLVAATLTVEGTASIEELERAGAFGGLRVYPREASDDRPAGPSVSDGVRAWLRPTLAALLLADGWIAGELHGESSPAAVVPLALAIAVGGGAMLVRGVRGLLRLRFNMNTLMTLAVAGAAAIGEWREGATVVLLFSVATALEAWSVRSARRAVRELAESLPAEAAVVRNGDVVRMPAADVRPGDTIVVKPGEKIPLDGVVRAGTSSVLQAAVTGESAPAPKLPGDPVYAGTVNLEGRLEIEATKRADESVVAGIVRLVERAQADKPHVQTLIESFAAVYTPVVVATSALVAFVPPIAFGGSWTDWLYRGLALLVAACPCALVLSTPVSVVSALGLAARDGVFVKAGKHLETLARVGTVVFDKTGTLTEGRPEVADWAHFGGPDADACWRLLEAIERDAGHPLADAIVRKAAECAALSSSARPRVEQVTVVPGRGVVAVADGVRYRVGHVRLFEENGPVPNEVRARIGRFEREGMSVVLFGDERSIFMALGISDRPRPESRRAIEELRKAGVGRIAVLTGDNRRAALSLTRRLGIDDVRAELLPADKLRIVGEWRANGPVMMVGDGVNDAPALAAADVGVAIGRGGTDLAAETADVVLTGDDLTGAASVVRLGRRTVRVIRQNVAWSLGLKAAVFALVPFGWLTLWLAVLADMGATLLVTLNALRLARAPTRRRA